MNTIRMCAVTAAAMLLICGCVQITQEVHINHDGSGKIVEKITVLPRGVRLLEGMKKRKGGSGVPVLLSEEAFQKRLKAMGGVSVEKKEDVTLEDGRRQIETVYTFKNISNVVFWTAPTLSHKNTQKTRGGHNPNYQGKLTLNFRPEYERFGKLYKETVEIKASTSHQMPGQPRSSPAEQQKYRRVLPIFQDMLKDFKYSIVAVAPIESFEEPRRMLQNVRYDGNRVTVYELDGRGVIQAGDMIHQLIMREVVGPEMSRHQRSMPGVWTPWPAFHGGSAFRFMKPLVLRENAASEEPEFKEEKKKEKKKEEKKEPKKKPRKKKPKKTEEGDKAD